MTLAQYFVTCISVLRTLEHSQTNIEVEFQNRVSLNANSKESIVTPH